MRWNKTEKSRTPNGCHSCKDRADSWCSSRLHILEPVDRWSILPGRVELVWAEHLTLLHGEAEAAVHGDGILLQHERSKVTFKVLFLTLDYVRRRLKLVTDPTGWTGAWLLAKCSSLICEHHFMLLSRILSLIHALLPSVLPTPQQLAGARWGTPLFHITGSTVSHFEKAQSHCHTRKSSMQNVLNPSHVSLISEFIVFSWWMMLWVRPLTAAFQWQNEARLSEVRVQLFTLQVIKVRRILSMTEI